MKSTLGQGMASCMFGLEGEPRFARRPSLTTAATCPSQSPGDSLQQHVATPKFVQPEQDAQARLSPGPGELWLFEQLSKRAQRF